MEHLLESLAKTRPTEVRFEEIFFSNLLAHPFKTQDILRFTPPARLEKHIIAPRDERYLVEGDTVHVESKAKGTDRTLSLHDYPALRAFIEAFRSTLTNDITTLRRFYRVTLRGEPATVDLAFGFIHGMTLAFGITLLGVVDDYPIHLFSHLTRESRAPAVMSAIWPTMRLGVVATALGFSALLLSGFPGLSQLGLFAIVGLFRAAGTQVYNIKRLGHA